MTRKLHVLLGLILMLSASINAQNLIGDLAGGFEDTFGDYWIASPDAGTQITATPVYSTEQFAGATGHSIKLDVQIPDGAAVNSIRGKFQGQILGLDNTKIYTIKYKRYVVGSSVDMSSPAEKLYLRKGTSTNVVQVNKTPVSDISYQTWQSAKYDTWEELEYDINLSSADQSDLDIAYLMMQVNPGSFTVYYDDFSIEEKAFEPSVTFNITRPASTAQNVWITLNGTSKLISAKTDPVETSTTFTGIAAGTYTYYLMGKGYTMHSASITVAADADKMVDITIADDADNLDNQLVFYPNYSSTGPVDKLNSEKSLERAASTFVLKKDDDIIYNYAGTGYWIGNLNTVGATAGAIYTYRMEYTGSLYQTATVEHPEYNSAPATLKPREGFVPALTTLNANSTTFYKYFGWYDTYFVVKNENGEALTATITITDGGITNASTDANGVYMAELQDDGTTYSYSVSANGYITQNGTLEQLDASVTKDILEEVILVADGATALAPQSKLLTKVYPNPASNLLNIQALEGSQINLISVAGSKVRSVIATSAVSTISVSDLAKGIYLVEVINGTNKEVQKIQVK
ncbi:T9SS type A sorting domain-containing protein [Saccharicrinis aurantiacus]|uniref:T9SS type A sorting domain-containing protein n=1 Tax=Saccharicrinis aurantiacus TaxID=1849719 RepID=UPI0024935A4E|nr:T9SS type A sorting domain-containing protein [Saccharicrinis aurantiacus]